MSEEEISASGQFPVLNSTDFASSYRAPEGTTPQAGASASTAAETVSQTTAAAAAQPTQQPSAAQVSNALTAANANLASVNRTLDYRVDAVTGISIATIRNSQTGVVVQQIPGADIIALARMLAEWSPGKHMLVDLIA
jgi:flagellar protein FlaG